MQSFIAVATAARYIMLCAALVEATSARVKASQHPHTDATTSELNQNVASPNLARAGESNPSISDQGELLAARLEAVGVYDADGIGSALGELGLRTPADLELLDDWAVAELDKELTESGASLGDRTKLRIHGVKGTFSAAARPILVQARVHGAAASTA